MWVKISNFFSKSNKRKQNKKPTVCEYKKIPHIHLKIVPSIIIEKIKKKWGFCREYDEYYSYTWDIIFYYLVWNYGVRFFCHQKFKRKRESLVQFHYALKC